MAHRLDEPDIYAVRTRIGTNSTLPNGRVVKAIFLGGRRVRLSLIDGPYLHVKRFYTLDEAVRFVNYDAIYEYT